MTKLHGRQHALPSIMSHDHDAHDSRFNAYYHARHAIDNYSHTCIISGTLLIWHTIDLDRTMDGRPSTAQFGLAKSTSAPRPLRPTAISSVSGSPTPLCIPGVRDSGTGFTLGTSATYRRILLGISICHVVCYTLLVVFARTHACTTLTSVTRDPRVLAVFGAWASGMLLILTVSSDGISYLS